MNAHRRPTHVVLLPATAGAPATRLSVDADGNVLARELLPAQQPPPTAPTTRPAPWLVLVVPGTEAPAHWLEIQARGDAQARTEAAALLRDALAADPADTHVALAAAGEAGTPRAVVTVEHAALDAWLVRAAAFGLHPDAALPDHLALPPPGDPDQATVALRDGDWLARTATRSFRAEAALAKMVLGDRAHAPIREPAAVEALLARGAASAPLNLLQGRYATAGQRSSGPRAWRRAALLATLLLASVPLLWTAEAIRHLLAARGLEAAATEMVTTALPATPATAEPLAAARAALARARAHDGFPRAFGALAEGVEQLDGAAIERLSWQAGGPLRATVVHHDPGQLEALAATAAGSDVVLAAAGTRRADGRLLSEVELMEGGP